MRKSNMHKLPVEVAKALSDTHSYLSLEQVRNHLEIRKYPQNHPQRAELVREAEKIQSVLSGTWDAMFPQESIEG